MSILDALRVQQAENSSVRDLAMLPQAQIIKLAQMGQIPPAVVPIIISEKARMSQQAAQMQAAQSPAPPTVLEQAMAQNAQAEVPLTGVAAIPTQMFNEQNYASGGIVAFDDGGEVRTGVRKMPSPTFDKEEQELMAEYLKKIDDGRLMAALSKREGMPTVAQLLAAKALGDGEVSVGATGTPKELQAIMAGYSRPFAGGQLGVNAAIPARSPKTPQLGLSYARRFNNGGIVAFSQGGLYSSPGEADIYAPSESEYVAPGPAVGSLDAYIREAAARRAEARKPSEAMLALERSLTEPGRFREAKDEARNLALLQAGLGILGGTSPYALQNIGRGAAGAVESYGTQMRDIRGQEREALRQRAALDLKKQEAALADIASGEAQYTAAQKAALEEKKLASREEIERQRAESAERLTELRNEALLRSMGGGRETDRRGFVSDYVQGMRATGDTRPEEILRLEGQKEFNNQQARFGLAETQLQATIINQVDNEILQRQREMTRSDKEALREWKKRDENNTAADYWRAERDRRVTEKFAELAARTGAAPAAQPAAPRTQRQPSSQPPDFSKLPGFPPGVTAGKFVPGKGWEVLQNGKLIGHAEESQPILPAESSISSFVRGRKD
jgi:hypothetical protein